jgi:hypothetical protein
MGIIKQLVESTTDNEQKILTENELVYMFVQKRNMPRFRYKFLLKGTSRMIFIQTDRREFFSVELKGRKLMKDVKEYKSLPEADEAARQFESKGYRLVTNEKEVAIVLNALMVDLSRRSSVYSRSELPIVAPLVYVYRITIGKEEEIDDNEPSEIKRVSGEWAFIGRGWWRVME